MTTTSHVTLLTNDNIRTRIPREVAIKSRLIENALEDIDIDGENEDDAENVQAIPLANVTSNDLRRVVQFCAAELEYDRTICDAVDSNAAVFGTATGVFEGKKEALVQEIVAECTPSSGHDCLFRLIMAVNYLDIPSMMDCLCQFVAHSMIRGKTPEEIRRAFGVENTLTPEEEEEYRREHSWAFR
jgi:S-phase kinase-associated protein 1